MKTRLLLNSTALIVALTCATISHAQGVTQWHLPDGAKARLGKGSINEIKYSPDGTMLAVATNIGIWLYDTQTGEELNLIAGNKFEVGDIAFSPDGTMLASDSNDSSIRLWDDETGKSIIDEGNRTVRLWDVKSGRQIRTFTGHEYYITALAFSPDGKTIASGSASIIRLWNIESGKEMHAFTEPSGLVTSIAFSPDGKKLVASSSYKIFYLWDMETREVLHEFKGHTEGVNSVAFSPDGETIASGSSDNTFRLWDVETGVQRRSYKRHKEEVYGVSFSPDGRTLASRSADRTIRLTRVPGGDTQHVLTGHTQFIRSMAFSPDSKTLTSGSRDGTIRLWDVYSGRNRFTITGHIDYVFSIAYSPDGKSIVSGSQDGPIHLWDVDTGTTRHILTGYTSYIYSLAFSPDSKTIASSGSGTVRLWDADTGLERRTLVDIPGYVSLAFNPNGKTVACLITHAGPIPNASPHSRDASISLFDVETGAELYAIEAYKGGIYHDHAPEILPTVHTGPVLDITFSPHGNMIASSSSDGTIRLWHSQTGEHLRMVTKGAGYAYSLAFSPDGKMLANSSGDNIYLWDFQSGMQLHKFTGHTGFVTDVGFSPNSKMLASGGYDNTVRLWDTDMGAQLRVFKGHQGRVRSVAFSPDGSTLASGSTGGTILLWDVTPSVPSNTTVSLSPVSVESPVVGKQLTLSVNIADGQNVGGYQATVHFDSTALRYVKSANSDYLSASAYVMPPVVESNRVMLAATTFAEENGGDGTLATITFEVVATKASTVRLSDVLLTDSASNSITPKIIAATEITEPMFLPEDVNEDGAVNILDLAFIAANFGKTGKNAADVNRDGSVNIVDLALVAAKIGEMDAAAPALWSIKEKDMPTRATVKAWLQEARKLNLADPAFQRGLLVLESLLKALTPKETALLANYPNPFNPETWIPYQLATPADVSISIYAADGKLIRQLDLGHQSVGMYHHRSRAAHWDGKNTQGEPVASGVYFYTFTAGDFTTTRKMIVRK